MASTTPFKPPERNAGIVTSWIPLTTADSGHSSQCTSKFMQWDAGGDVIAWDPGFGVTVSPGLRCGPPAVTTWWGQHWLGPTTETVVSIGPFTCPDAFTQVATSVVNAHSTQVACCPSSYLFVDWMPPASARQCYSGVSAEAVIVVHTRLDCDKWTPVTTQINTSPTIWGAHINGWIFAAEQTAAATQSPEPTPRIIEPTSQSSGTTSPVSETASQSPQTTSQSPVTISPSSLSCNSSNSGNTKTIGIGVGASMAAVGLATLIASLIMMRRSRKMLRAARHQEEVPSDKETPQQDPRDSHERPVSPAKDMPYARQPHDKPAGELYGSDPTFFHSEAPAITATSGQVRQSWI